MNFVAKEMMPISVVEGEGFLEYSKALSPNYIVPSRFIIKRRLIGLYDTEKYKVTTKIQDLESLSLTTDSWTSRTMESYISLTAHGITKDWKKHQQFQ